MRRLLLKRLWVVVMAGVLAAVSTWLLVRSQTPMYERSLTLLLRPAPSLESAAYDDALSAIQAEDVGIDTTLLQIVARDPFRRRALEEGGIRSADTDYRLRPTIRPGTNVIEIAMIGPDRQALERLSDAVAKNASVLVGDLYNGTYRLQPLGGVPRRDRVEPKVFRSVQLAAVAGVLVVLGMIFIEARFRHRPAERRRSPTAST